MRFTDILTLLASSLNVGIGLFVLKKYSRFSLHRAFSIFSINTGLWAFSNFLFYFYPTRFLLETQYALGALVIPTSIIWVHFLLKNVLTKQRLYWLIILSALLFIAPYCDGLIVQNLQILGKHEYQLILSPLFNVYGAIYILLYTYQIIIIIKRFRQTTGLLRQQLKYIFAGVLTFGSVSLFVSVILPLFNISLVAPIDAQSSLLFVGFSMYAIIRHRLLDIRVVVTRSILYVLLLTLVTLMLVYFTVGSTGLLRNTRISQTFISFLIAGIIVFGLDPLKRWLSRVTDKVFFQAKIDYAQLLQKLSNIASLELNLQKLIDDLERGVIEGLKVKGALILLRDQEKGVTQKFRATDESGSNLGEIVIDNDSALIQFLREHRHLSLLESLERKIEDTPEGSDKKQQEASKAEFMRIGAALVAPIFSQDHLVAILTLGPKLSGDSFSNDDTHLIEVLAPQIGSAIQKANLYEEVREFSEDLKVKVNEATKELRDRNVSLQTLQNITKDITRTLDFNKVVQNIANAVSTELGFLGAILIFVDDDGKTLRARAVTETPLTTKAIQLLPKPFSSYVTDLTNPKHHTLAFDVLMSGEVRYTDSMPDVISPPIPKPVVMAMQKLMGIKTMILVPITSEDRVIGVIEVGAKRKREAISDSEIETIQSMADELGVVARNISLFDRVRRTNDQLEQANVHLKQLDQAKSEFVSIASHQLRTPMTGIMGYLSMMTQGDFGKIKPEHQKILVDLLNESQRMIRLINQFLNVSKIEAGKFTYAWKPTQIEDLIEHVVKEVEKAAGDKGLKLTVKYPKTKLPQIQADTDKVEDVILNLLDNAIKYTAKGTVTASVMLEGDRVHFAVKDSGIGIKPQDATELFNKFVRGSGIAQIHPDGSGLGLFIAKSIIDAHGGRIWAESEGEGKGSTFQFSLPMQPPVDEVPSLHPAAHVVSESTR